VCRVSLIGVDEVDKEIHNKTTAVTLKGLALSLAGYD